MKMVVVWRTIDAPAAVVWRLLTNVDQWSDWGPTVRSARLDGNQLGLGARGTVTTVVGLKVPFQVTEFSERNCWAWNVAGLPATDHRVQEQGPDRCRAGLGVPWLAAGYLPVCQLALRRLETMALAEVAGS